MYKKLAITTIFVISFLLIMWLVYWLVTRTPSTDSPITIEDPYIEVYHTQLSSPNPEYLHDNFKGEELTLDSKLFDNGARVLLECYAAYPIKWHYEGTGGLVTEASHYNVREKMDMADERYWYRTRLEFPTVTEQITGRYVCASIPTNNQRSIYIYGNSKRPFVSKDDVVVEVEPGNEATVFCPVSDPRRKVELVQLLQPLDSTLFKSVDSDHIKSYDPKEGFKLKPNQWGTYACKDVLSDELSSLTKVYKPLRLVVKGAHLQSYITVPPIPRNTSGLRILCEATENVTLNFINFERFARRQVYFYNDSTETNFPFTTRIIMRNEYFRNYSIIDCVSAWDGRLLRQWKYLRREWSDKITFGFNAKEKAYECCTFNMEIPRLTHAPCHTQTECEMKESCVKLENKCPYEKILSRPLYKMNSSCVMAKVKDTLSGIIQCSYRNASKNYIYFYSPESGFHNFTSSDFRHKNIPLEKLLELKQRDYLLSYNGHEFLQFDCSGPKFFFAHGFRWATVDSKATHYLQADSSDDVQLEEEPEKYNIHTTLRIKKQLLRRKKVSCYAPVTHSDTWVSKTVSVRHANPPRTNHIR